MKEFILTILKYALGMGVTILFFEALQKINKL